MGHVIVKWGKLHVELPGEVFLALLFKAFLIAHLLSGERFRTPSERFPPLRGSLFHRPRMRLT